MAAIFLLSAAPAPEVAGSVLGVPGLDKLLHAAEYALLGFLLMLGLRRAGVEAPYAAVTVGIAYAASDELHQAFVPGRTADPLDALADVAGVLLGVLLVLRLYRPARVEERRADGGAP
jgi:VanZ family protein